MSYSKATMYLFLVLFSLFVLWAINALLETAEAPESEGDRGDDRKPPVLERQDKAPSIVERYAPDTSSKEKDLTDNQPSGSDIGRTTMQPQNGKEAPNEKTAYTNQDTSDMPVPLDEDAPPPPTGTPPPGREKDPELVR